MEKSQLMLFYKSFYNYFLKKDGYNRALPFLASSVCAICYLFILGTCVSIIYIFTDIRFKLSIHKSISFIVSLSFFYLIYLIHIYFFKLPKRGKNSDYSFTISDKSYNLSFKLFIGICCVFFSIYFLQVFLNR